MKKIPTWLRHLVGGFCLSLPILLDGKAPILAATLAFFAGIPALYLLFSDVLGEEKHSYRAYLHRGFFFGYGFHLGVYHWFISVYPLDFIADFTALEAIGVVFVAWFGLALVSTACYAFIHPTFALAARLPFVRRHALLLPPLFAAVMTVFSYLISLTWAGVPWGNLALSQTAHPYLVGSASLFGSYLTTFVVLFVNGMLALALYAYRRASGKARTWTCTRLPLLLAACVFLLNTLTGALLYHAPHEKAGTLTVLLLQGNVSSREKWTSEGESLFERYERLLRTSVVDSDEAGRHPDLVIWSESALLTDLPTHEQDATAHSRALASLSEELQLDQLVGAFCEEEDEDGTLKRYNSLFLYRADGTVSENVYHKRRPVPFGEFTPWKPLINALFPFMAELVMSSDLSPGEDSRVFSEDSYTLGTLICFDSIYENLARDAAADGAQALIVSTNDSWFGSSAALDNHHSQSILRAVENGRDLARAGNTGITSVISRRGEVKDTLPILEEGYLLEELDLYEDKTLYTRVGNLFLFLCGGFYFACTLPDLLAFFKRKRALKKEKGADCE